MNADQKLVRDFVKNGGHPLAITSSPLSMAVNATIVHVSEAPVRAELSFEPGPTFLQANGVIQGGAVAIMLDMAMAFAALHNCADGQLIATANMNVSYLRAAPIAKWSVVGEVERFGRSLIFAKASMQNSDGIVAATATSTLSILGGNQLRGMETCQPTSVSFL